MRPSGSAGGMVPLKAVSSPGAILPFLIIFAVIWNGISWSVFFGFLAENNFRWSNEYLFISIFLLVGIGFVIAVFYNLSVRMRWRGTRVLGTSPLLPGGVFEYEVSLPHRCPAVIEQYRTSIRCVEEVRYRVGTDTRTATNTIYEVDIEKENDIQGHTLSAAPRPGALAFPADAMHSFKSTNNKLRWEFTLNIAAPGCPDLKAQYEIEVLPGQGA